MICTVYTQRHRYLWSNAINLYGFYSYAVSNDVSAREKVFENSKKLENLYRFLLRYHSSKKLLTVQCYLRIFIKICFYHRRPYLSWNKFQIKYIFFYTFLYSAYIYEGYWTKKIPCCFTVNLHVRCINILQKVDGLSW